jgi:microcystin-dependent protein
MNNNNIINLGDANADTDAISRGYADDRYVNNTGDTITGDLTITGELEVTDKLNVNSDNTIIAPNLAISDINNGGNQSLTTKNYVDDAIERSMPTGSIIMWSGTSIPSGWALCDGSNGTPDLLDRFVMGGSISEVGTTGGYSDATLVSHDHTFTGDTLSPHHHSLTTTVGTVGGTNGSDDSLTDPAGVIDTDDTSAGTPSGTISTVGESEIGKNIPPFYKLAYIIKI